MKPPVAIVDIGTKHHLTGRAAAIVALVCCYAERINAMRAGEVAFNCGPNGQIKPRLGEWLEEVTG